MKSGRFLLQQSNSLVKVYSVSLSKVNKLLLYFCQSEASTEEELTDLQREHDFSEEVPELTFERLKRLKGKLYLTI